MDKIELLKEWFDEKILLIQKYFDNEFKTVDFIVFSGDIYFAKLGINVGSEIDKQRPVLVFQSNSKFNKISNIVFVIPITTKGNKANRYTVCVNKNDLVYGNIKNGLILINQSRSISKIRLIRKIGKLNSLKLNEVCDCFYDFLYKKTPPNL